MIINWYPDSALKSFSGENHEKDFDREQYETGNWWEFSFQNGNGLRKNFLERRNKTISIYVKSFDCYAHRPWVKRVVLNVDEFVEMKTGIDVKRGRREKRFLFITEIKSCKNILKSNWNIYQCKRIENQKTGRKSFDFIPRLADAGISEKEIACLVY